MKWVFLLRVSLFFWWMCVNFISLIQSAVALEATFTEAVFINWDTTCGAVFRPFFAKEDITRLNCGLAQKVMRRDRFCFASRFSQQQPRVIHPASHITISLFVSLALLCLPVNMEIVGRTPHLPPSIYTFLLCRSMIHFHKHILIYLSTIKISFGFWLKR